MRTLVVFVLALSCWVEARRGGGGFRGGGGWGGGSRVGGGSRGGGWGWGSSSRTSASRTSWGGSG